LAFSLDANRSHDFTESAKVARELTEKALDEGLPPGTLLNINVPKGAPKGFRVTKQGFKNARPVISEHIDPRGKPYYWIGEVRDGFHLDEEGGTDFEAVEQGFVSVTPMRSDLTNYAAMERLQSWEK
jgi:5'-nucleotidase